MLVLSTQVPESPMWLVSKGRDGDAVKSLRWLRGWVPQHTIQSEFDSIRRCKAASDFCETCKRAEIKCSHTNTQTTGANIKEMIEKRTLKPFVILMVLGAVTFFSGTHHLTAYMVQILNTFNSQSPISPNVATVRFCSSFFRFQTCLMF